MNSKETVEIVEDVFRRMDKNDDQKIQLEEFLNYFNDDIVSDHDLELIFKSMDTNGDGTISLSELYSYFETGIGPMKKLFDSLIVTNTEVNSCMKWLSTNYSPQSYNDKFKTRFYLREVQRFLESLYHTADSAMLALEKQTEKHRPDETLTLPKPHTHLAHSFDLSVLQSEVSKLSAMLGEYSMATAKNPMPSMCPRSTKDVENPECYTVRRSDVQVSKENSEAYIKVLSEYVSSTRDQEGCIYCGAFQKVEGHFVITSVWVNEVLHKAHYESASCKAYRHALVDLAEIHPVHSKIDVPACWFCH